MPVQAPDYISWLGDLGRYAQQSRLHQEVTNAVKVLRGKGKSPQIFFFIVPRRGAPCLAASRCSFCVLSCLLLPPPCVH